MAKDAYWPNVTLALSLNGVEGSQSFPDGKGRAVTTNGNVRIDTTKYAPIANNTASAYFDGTGDFLGIPNGSGLFDFGTGDFTIEGWINPGVVGSTRRFLATHNGSTGWYVEVNTANRLTFASTAGAVSQASGGFSINTWYHFAIVRYAGTLTFYIDGTANGSGSLSGSLTYGLSLQVGRLGTQDIYGFIGNLDDIRITKGVARYLSNFTRPTEPFPNGGYEVAGTVVDSNGSPVARTIRVYDRVTGVLNAVGVSNAASGTYSIPISTANEVQVVLLDDLLGTIENDQILRTTPV
ncbi:MAG: LamG domain-containing protein [Acidobacteria bacterium]|nr:LamG domain-containing protein [Acidobacteriota bacterium]